jgi:NADH-quinone oxidoreductase subunit D
VGLVTRLPLGDEASSTRATTFEDLVVGNEIFEARTRRIGIIPAELGAAYGVSGSNLRASGVDWDLRRDGKPYLVYPELDFKVWTHPDGDSFARYWVRLAGDARVGAHGAADARPDAAGPIMAKVPRIIKVPEGEVWVETENPLGQMGYYVVSKGATGPFRVKIRSASFSNVSILPWLLRGVYVPDVDHDPRVALLHPRGHRPMTHVASRARDRWGTTLAIKTIIVLAIVPPAR